MDGIVWRYGRLECRISEHNIVPAEMINRSSQRAGLRTCLTVDEALAAIG